MRKSRTYHVDPDALLAIINRGRLGKTDDPKLARAVGRVAVVAGLGPVDGRDVHNCTLAVFQHCRYFVLPAHPHTLQVHAHHIIPLRFFDISDRCRDWPYDCLLYTSDAADEED